MGEVHMDTEDILAEPEDTTESIFGIVIGVLQAYGWYIILALVAIYFYFKPRFAFGGAGGAASSGPKSPAELQAWQLKEEQRKKAVERLQAKYAQDAAVTAERQKELEEKKRKEKLEEKQKLAGMVDVGEKLGSGDSSKKSLRPEFNPLMGDQGSSGRVCFRRPGGGAGGGG